MKYTNFLWIIPFGIFISTYALFAFLLPHKTIVTPNVLGQSLHQALRTLSSCNLTTKIIKYKEDPDLPEGTILSQSPQANKRIKPGQTVLMVVSTQPPKQHAPSFIGLTREAIQQSHTNNEIIPKFFNVISPYPKGTCIAQIPNPKQAIESKTVLCYMSHQNVDYIILPDFSGYSIPEVATFLQSHSITPSITHTKPHSDRRTCDRCIVISQKPLAGSIVSLKKIPNIQIHT